MSTGPATPATAPSADAACSREALQQRLQAYLDAMSQGSPGSLPVHPKLYYTENGQEQTLGRGLWLSRPQARFARYALDTESCGSVTEAVLADALGEPIILGLRLRYVDDLLIDVEAMVVQRSLQLFAPDAIVVPEPDPWLAPVSDDKRLSPEELVAVAENFFASILQPALSPARAPSCELRQNGVAVGGGNCTPGSAAERFEQLRYPVVDATTGLVGGVGLGHDYLVMFLFKIEGGELINIDLVGGHPRSTTGW